MPNGPAISSSNISNSDSLNRHSHLIQQTEVPPPEALVNERGHQVGVMLSEYGGINKPLMNDDGGMGGDKLPKRSVPSGSGVGGADSVVPSGNVKGKAMLQAELFCISPEEKTGLGTEKYLLKERSNMLDFLSEVWMRNPKALELLRPKEGSPGDVLGDPSLMECGY